jgi:magnesium chelatase subunit D
MHKYWVIFLGMLIQRRVRPVFPFPAIVGMEDAKLALMVAAVNPSVGGVLLRGDKGTGKTTLVRSFADVLPEEEVVAGCPFNCHPDDPRLMCDACYERWSRGEPLSRAKRKMRVVDLPLSITVDRLVGTLDIKRALKEGIRALQPGLLAEANRNILYIDEVNLLDDYVIDVLLDAAAYGWNIIEREGVSIKHPARFILVGSMNPEEGELRPQLLDRFGLVVDIEAPKDPEIRAEIVRRVEEYEADPFAFYEKWRPKVEEIRERIVRARELVGKVVIPDDMLRFLAETVVKMNVRTSRAEIITARAARAIASLDGRTRVTAEDLKKAMELALKHRIKSRPLERPPPPPPPPLNVLSMIWRGHRRGEGLSGRERGEGEQREAPERRRGQGRGDPPLASPHKHDSGVGQILDVERALGLERSKTPEMPRGLRSRHSWRRVVGGHVGIPYMAVPGTGDDVDIAATITHAALKRPGGPLEIADDDLMVRVRRARAPRVMLILLDTSGSMGFARRIGVAKGLVYRLAEEAYVKRSYIALAAFRGDGIDYFHPPTRHYERIVEELSRLPHGGSTPLSAALKFAIDFISRLKLKLRGDYWVYLITDGKANVPLRDNIREEVAELAAGLSKLAKLVVYDASPGSLYPGVSYIGVLAQYAHSVERV